MTGTDLCVNKPVTAPVIFEPPCILQGHFTQATFLYLRAHNLNLGPKMAYPDWQTQPGILFSIHYSQLTYNEPILYNMRIKVFALRRVLDCLKISPVAITCHIDIWWKCNVSQVQNPPWQPSNFFWRDHRHDNL